MLGSTKEELLPSTDCIMVDRSRTDQTLLISGCMDVNIKETKLETLVLALLLFA